MITLTKTVRNAFTTTVAAAILAATLLAPSLAKAGVFFSVSIAPPPIPVYDQPLCPGEGYLWTPGYWAYDQDRGYFWVEGAWVEAPYEGALWTPGYWAYNDGAYLWNAGYWGNTVGYYGGIDYGFGYAGTGFYGGYWNGGRFFYNRGFNRLDLHRIQSTYNDPNHGGTPVHPGGRAFDPHPPAGAGRFAENRGDERGSRINGGRDFRGTVQGPASNGFSGNAHMDPAPQGINRNSFPSQGNSAVHDNHIVAIPNPRQSGYSPEVNQGFRGTPQAPANDGFNGNAHIAPAPQGVDRNGFTQGQQNGVQQYRLPQQDASQQYRVPSATGAVPQYRLPQQQPYNAAPQPMPRQSTGSQPAGPTFDRSQPRSVSPPAASQNFAAPAPQQPHSSPPSGGGVHGSAADPRR